jgi:limonene-1,2-epoxide hydrolase
MTPRRMRCRPSPKRTHPDERKAPRQLDLLCICRRRGRHALDSLRNGGDHGDTRRRNGPRARGDLMTEVIDRLVVAMNAHDLDAAAGFFHEDYHSEQPAHPGRAFVGRAQMRANWEAMFAGISDFYAEICRSVQDDETTWTEWRWSGTRSDGQAFEVRGVTLFEVTGDQIVAGRLYLEDVERDLVGIEQVVEALSGRRPRPTQQ